MKFYDTHFVDYIKSNNSCSLHPKLNALYKTMSPDINKFKNTIFYGPEGVGKYTQMIAYIKQYSPSELKYEKKISITYNKNTYLYKISDIHYEIDMSLLGCHSKLLWNEIYNNIIDIILAKQYNTTGIIVCKYFHEIHSDLLDNFYSYMQTIPFTTLNLKFILITEQLSFIPNNILNCCQLINVSRPTQSLYTKCFKNYLPNKETLNIKNIKNIKNILASVNDNDNNDNIIYNKILSLIINSGDNENPNPNENQYLLLRDNLYNILIYNLNINDFLWYILYNLLEKNKITSINSMSQILVKIYRFLFYYNNNYRPISHLESITLFLIKTIHNL
jgi:hypothetical protein